MLREIYPYVDEEGKSHPNLIKHCSDENKYILQVETGLKYRDAIDLYPCKFTYEETDEEIVEDKIEEEKVSE